MNVNRDPEAKKGRECKPRRCVHIFQISPFGGYVLLWVITGTQNERPLLEYVDLRSIGNHVNTVSIISNSIFLYA